MDPASLSFAVVDMFLTCCKGYKFLSDTKNATSDAQDAARRIAMEYYVLGNWGSHFELDANRPRQPIPEKLKFSLTNDHARRGVFSALCTISATFTDVKALDRKYGIVCKSHWKGDRKSPVPQELVDFLDGRADPPGQIAGSADKTNPEPKRAVESSRIKMSLLEKCRWSIRDKDCIKDLIARLRECNEDLARLCFFEPLAQINQALPGFVLAQKSNFMDLHKVADIAEQSAHDKISPTAAGREKLAEMARFKAKLMTPSKIANKYQTPWRLLDQRYFEICSHSRSYSMGTSLRDQDPVFVEWQSYRGEDNRPNRLAEEQIIELGRFLSVPRRPHELRGLDCIGLFKDTTNDRYGVVYNLPAHLRRLTHSRKTESRRIYNPGTMTDFINPARGAAALGDRFDLARKLIRSVVALHACGWLHKNICPENILFFAPKPTSGEAISAIEKDFSHPVIVGYGLSRPDDIPNKEVHSDPQVSRAHPASRVACNKAFPKGYSIYQHPDKATDRHRRFRHSYDIYSLGLVLLELGLCQDLQKLNAFKDIYEFRQHVLKRLVPDLWSRCGSIYGGVVRECLTLRTNDDALADEAQRNLALKLAERLDRCVA
ncbi:MAG: hypothetical protein Q9221_007992 [Calogaya cf. arnoldii]